MIGVGSNGRPPTPVSNNARRQTSVGPGGSDEDVEYRVERGREVANDHAGTVVRWVRRGPDGGLVDVSGLRVTWPRVTVPVAPDEATARQLLDRRSRVLVRHIDLSSHALGAAGAGFVSRLVSA
jgi:hypothetical protein